MKKSGLMNFEKAKKIIFLKKIKKCIQCGSTDCIQVHHKDGDCKNNNLNNLKILCQICHYKEHKKLGFGKGSRLVLELEENEHQKFKEKSLSQKKSMRDILRMLIKKWLKE